MADGKDDKKPPPQPADREARLAAALRANLRRRKAKPATPKARDSK
jgi:hypothetical protein